MRFRPFRRRMPGFVATGAGNCLALAMLRPSNPSGTPP